MVIIKWEFIKLQYLTFSATNINSKLTNIVLCASYPHQGYERQLPLLPLLPSEGQDWCTLRFMNTLWILVSRGLIWSHITLCFLWREIGLENQNFLEFCWKLKFCIKIKANTTCFCANNKLHSTFGAQVKRWLCFYDDFEGRFNEN